jgi:hypothetical protein
VFTARDPLASRLVAGSLELLQRTSQPAGAGDCDWLLVRVLGALTADFCSIAPGAIPASSKGPGAQAAQDRSE